MSVRRAFNAEPLHVVAAEPAIPGLREEQQNLRALEQSRGERENEAAKATEAARQAGFMKGKLQDAVDRGEHVEQADLDAEDEKIREALATFEKMQDSVKRFDAKIEESKGRVDSLKREELRRRAPLLRAASEAVRLRGEEDYAASKAECNRLAALYDQARQTANNHAATDKTLDAALDDTAGFAPRRG
jgi:DNA repair exonuclease SbcCD ATPase subunit